MSNPMSDKMRSNTPAFVDTHSHAEKLLLIIAAMSLLGAVMTISLMALM